MEIDFNSMRFIAVINERCHLNNLLETYTDKFISTLLYVPFCRGCKGDFIGAVADAAVLEQASIG